MSKTQLALVISSLLFGCSGDRLLIPPSPPGTEAALVLSPSQPALAVAVDRSGSEASRLTLPTETDSAPLFVSFYSCTLSELAIDPGRIALRDTAGRSFPSADQTYRWLEDGTEEWAPVTEDVLTEAIEPLRLDQDEAPSCNDFPLLGESTLHVLPAESFPRRLIGLNSGGAALTVPRGLYWVHADSALVEMEDPLLQVKDAQIIESDGDEVIIVPSRGPMLVGNETNGLRVFGPASPTATTAMMLARSPNTFEGLELFVFSALGLSRYDGTAWTIVDTTLRTFSLHTRLHGVWLGPSEVVFLPSDQEREEFLLHWVGTTLEMVPLPDIPRSLSRIDSGPIFVGTENGLLLELEPSELHNVESRVGWTRPTRPLWVVEPLERSVFVSGWAGLINEYYPGQGYCSETGLTPDLRSGNLIDLDRAGTDGALMGVGISGGTESFTRLLLVRFGRSSALPTRCPN